MPRPRASIVQAPSSYRSYLGVELRWLCPVGCSAQKQKFNLHQAASTYTKSPMIISPYLRTSSEVLPATAWTHCAEAWGPVRATGVWQGNSNPAFPTGPPRTPGLFRYDSRFINCTRKVVTSRAWDVASMPYAKYEQLEDVSGVEA